MNGNGSALLEAKGVTVRFKLAGRAFDAVKSASLEVRRGETLSLVGESGSGKTTLGRAILRLYPLREGSIRFDGERIDGRLSRARERAFRQRAQMIFQDPMASLNERAKVDYIVSEGLRSFGLYSSEEERREKVARALEAVGLPADVAGRFPHEFSGGQRQRIGIARALVMEPELVVADEPISALDVSIRAQVINLMNDLKAARSLTYLFIAHDLGVVRFISDRIAVIRKGRIVEVAEAEELFERPEHPYTRALLSAIPLPDPAIERDRTAVAYEAGTEEDDPSAPWEETKPGHFVLRNHK
jgi:oligopeptide transport system ATP-binding protein